MLKSAYNNKLQLHPMRLIPGTHMQCLVQIHCSAILNNVKSQQR